MKLPLWCEVFLHEDTGHNPKVSWVELFFDLQYVPIVFKLGIYLKEHTTVSAVGFSFGLFLCFFMIRLHSNMIFGRFSNDDIFGKVIFYIIQAGVLVMAVHLDTGIEDDADQMNLAIALLVCKCALLVYYIKCAYYVPHARNHLYVTMSGVVIGIILTVIAVFDRSPGNEIALFTGGNVAEAVFHIVSESFPQFRVPMAVDHCAERTGLLIILALGEAVLGIALAPVNNEFRHGVVLIMGFTLVFCLSLLYFDSQPLDEDKHALWRSQLRGITYTYLHLFLAYSIFAVGVGVAGLVKYSGKGVTCPEGIGRLVSVFSGTTCVLFQLSRFLHKSIKAPRVLSVMKNGSRLLMGLFMCVLAEITTDPLTLVSSLMTLVIVLNVLDSIVFCYTHKESQLSVVRIAAPRRQSRRMSNTPLERKNRELRLTANKAAMNIMAQMGQAWELRRLFMRWAQWAHQRHLRHDDAMIGPAGMRKKLAKLAISTEPYDGDDDTALRSPRHQNSSIKSPTARATPLMSPKLSSLLPSHAQGFSPLHKGDMILEK
eukprot:PhF_6_TR42759/c0_g1_i1/m.64665